MKHMDIVSIGILAIVVGIIMVILGSLFQKTADAKYAVIGFFGPIPFGFGNDRTWLIASVAIALSMLALWYLFGGRFL